MLKDSNTASLQAKMALEDDSQSSDAAKERQVQPTNVSSQRAVAAAAEPGSTQVLRGLGKNRPGTSIVSAQAGATRVGHASTTTAMPTLRGIGKNRTSSVSGGRVGATARVSYDGAPTTRVSRGSANTVDDTPRTTTMRGLRKNQPGVNARTRRSEEEYRQQGDGEQEDNGSFVEDGDPSLLVDTPSLSGASQQEDGEESSAEQAEGQEEARHVVPTAYLVSDSVPSSVPHDLPEAEIVDPRIAKRRFQFGVGLCLVVSVVLVVVLVQLVPRGGPENGSTPVPTHSPTGAPSSAPSLPFPLFVLSLLPLDTQEKINFDTFSPQRSAFDWLMQDPNVKKYSNERLVQRFVLATLYHSTGGDDSDLFGYDPWKNGYYNQSTWLAYHIHECEWLGSEIFDVSSLRSSDPASPDFFDDRLCTPDETVTGNVVPADQESGILEELRYQYLFFLELRGTIPPEISLLPHLKGARFGGRGLKGSIPTEIGILQNLETLEILGSYDMTGTVPSEIGKLENLFFFALFEFGRAPGTIPTELGMLSKLQGLVFKRILFEGSLPTEIGNLSSLIYLIMESHPFMQGTLPTEIGRLQSLVLLTIIDSGLTGKVPSEIGLMSKDFEILDLPYNSLTGFLPTEIGLLPLIEVLSLGNNKFSGTIPSELATLGNLEAIVLTDNSLITGSILPAMNTVSRRLEYVRVRSTQLSGSIPADFCQIEILEFNCSAFLCGCDCSCNSTSSNSLL